MKVLFLGLVFLVVANCARSPIKTHTQALRVANKAPVIEDMLSLDTLELSLKENIEYLSSRPEDQIMEFGPYKLSAQDYGRSLQPVLEILQNKDLDDSQKKEQIKLILQTRFEILEVYGTEEWGQIFMTAYFEPKISASKKPTERHSVPLYKTPEDLVTVDYESFLEIYPQYRPPGILLTEQKSAKSVLRGRLVELENKESEGVASKKQKFRAGKLKKKKNKLQKVKYKVVPFYDRKEIDQDKALQGKKLEIAWVDPIDSFFLQIQGSGILEFEDGQTLQVGYASQNGHPYVPIGRFLFDVIPREKMSLQTIEAHLKTLSPEDMQELLNKNPSYVFFNALESRSITSMGTPTVAGRTIATDRRFFPKGALAYLVHEMPQFQGEAQDPTEWKAMSRLVVDQDTGGAIRGPGRLDLYLGAGKEARRDAGVMKRSGRLYYFFPKENLTNQVTTQN